MEQPELLSYAVDLLERLNVPYMVVGSMASSTYGEPRMTLDIDIVVHPTPDQLEEICHNFNPSDFYVSIEAARQALRLRQQFNVLDPASGNKIDFMIAGTDEWGTEGLARRQRMRLLPNCDGYAARPEDIILSKMLYYQEGGSEKHLRDISGMLRISAGKIDHTYVNRWAETLGVTDIWDAVQNRLAHP